MNISDTRSSRRQNLLGVPGPCQVVLLPLRDGFWGRGLLEGELLGGDGSLCFLLGVVVVAEVVSLLRITWHIIATTPDFLRLDSSVSLLLRLPLIRLFLVVLLRVLVGVGGVLGRQLSRRDLVDGEVVAPVVATAKLVHFVLGVDFVLFFDIRHLIFDVVVWQGELLLFFHFKH